MSYQNNSKSLNWKREWRSIGYLKWTCTLFWTPSCGWKGPMNKGLSILRAFSNSLFRAIITHNHMPFFKIFYNFVHFCPNFQIFCPFWPFLNIFLLFFCKIACAPLLCRIGPDPSFCFSVLKFSLDWFISFSWNSAWY